MIIQMCPNALFARLFVHFGKVYDILSDMTLWPRVRGGCNYLNKVKGI